MASNDFISVVLRILSFFVKLNAFFLIGFIDEDFELCLVTDRLIFQKPSPLKIAERSYITLKNVNIQTQIHARFLLRCVSAEI